MSVPLSKPLGGLINHNHPLGQQLVLRLLLNERTHAFVLAEGAPAHTLINSVDGSVGQSQAAPNADPWVHLDGGALDWGSSTNAAASFGSGGITADIAQGPCTIMVRSQNAGSLSYYGGFLERNDGNTVNAGWIFGLNGFGTPTFVVEHATTNMRAVTTIASPPTDFYWLTVTHDGSLLSANAKFYLNGVQLVTGAGVNGVGITGSDAANSLLFRSATFNAGSFSHGAINSIISDVSVWKRVLSQQDILQYIADPYCMLAKRLKQPQRAGLGSIDTSGGVSFGAPTLSGSAAIYGLSGGVSFGAPALLGIGQVVNPVITVVVTDNTRTECLGCFGDSCVDVPVGTSPSVYGDSPAVTGNASTQADEFDDVCGRPVTQRDTNASFGD